MKKPSVSTIYQAGDEFVVSRRALIESGMGDDYAGKTLDDIDQKARKAMEVYLSRFNELISKGYGLAFAGGQGTGKTTSLALIAEGAIRYLPEPTENQWESTRRLRVVYVRMPLFLRYLSDFVPATERREWERRYREYCKASLLLIDEAQAVSDNDRSGSMLLDLIDTRVSERRPIFMAMNMRWNDLRTDNSRLLQQTREKLEGVTREVAFPGTSRRKAWSL